MTTTLITGANRGLGLETARRLVDIGHTVLLGARDPRRGAEAAAEIGAVPLVIDVTSEDSVRAAAESLDGLDVLVNNAGVPGAVLPPGQASPTDLLAAYEINLFGPVRVLNAFLPLLESSPNPVVVNVSSRLGSIDAAAKPDPTADDPHWIPVPVYSSAKAALNMLTAQYARAFPAMRINSVCPGFTATDFNGHRGVQTVAEGTEIIVRMATTGPDGPTGGFFSREGEVAW
ncbi:SDR family NAD(P)-dependent oxidoreductase [Saccharopolyspora endophytica]|uniref:SDR family NAD(P)-dependent oxidoreductase n=1 Tax=Saccharopolyspora endophytica TaxID=543886 RepID=A0ABS5DDX2_9PSEU|nr:SDR family NAD(P)-dependent oxidoreductase [Saccharopolyspora endophytica]MBQ0924485.1 SDR family NAD(P)-dependent oxidoreductase [Saccharopolyspora endophytica]